MTTEAKRSWRRKRRFVAASVWFAVAYPLGAGPVVYLLERGWLPVLPTVAFYAPLLIAGEAVPTVGRAMEAYTRPFERAGRAAAAAE